MIICRTGPMVAVEFADAIIRIADLAGYPCMDLGGAIAEKLEKFDSLLKTGRKHFDVRG
jgi:hypothetical protein